MFDIPTQTAARKADSAVPTDWPRLKFKDGDPKVPVHCSFLVDVFCTLCEREWDRAKTTAFLNHELEHNAALRSRFINEVVGMLIAQRAARALLRGRL